MIDYGLTFTKRGCKPYLTIRHKEVCHNYDADLKAVPTNNFRTKFLLKFDKDKLEYFIYSKLTFQGYFLINRDGSKIPPGSLPVLDFFFFKMVFFFLVFFFWWIFYAETNEF